MMRFDAIIELMKATLDQIRDITIQIIGHSTIDNNQWLEKRGLEILSLLDEIHKRIDEKKTFDNSLTR